MESLPYNGGFVQRRKMFRDAPFHNQQSFIPLSWETSQETTDEVIRAKKRYEGEKQNVRKTYEQKVEEKLNQRLTQIPYSSIENEKRQKRRSEDVLTRELEVFNTSKIMPNQSPRVQEMNRQNFPQNQIGLRQQNYPIEGQQSRSRSINATQTIQSINPIRSDNNRQYRSIQSQQSAEYRPQHSYKLEESRQYRGGPDQSYAYNPEPRNNMKNYDEPYRYSRDEPPSPVQDRYRSLNVSRNQYPPSSLGKDLQKLYTGSKQENYAFRNVKPDNLQNHLRLNTKADRQRAYQVKLNLFKH